MEETIIGISTAIGEAAIHMVRLSGPDAIKIVDTVFKGKNKLSDAASHTVQYGHIYNNKGEVLDEVLVSVFLPPRSYTAELTVEISCHGGIIVMMEVYNALQAAGARAARAGEFTERAFLNGRIDLVQAEAVMSVIESENTQQLRLAQANLQGKLSKQIAALREKVLEIIAVIEVNIDYPEYDDVDEMTHELLLPKMKEIKSELNQLISRAESGKRVSDGIKVAIVGRPNVGKSSILNMLLEEEKAIVTNIAGTTRDIVEGVIRLGNIKLKLIDTAGIRETEDVVEQIGVERSRKAIEEAELILTVLNQVEGVTGDDEILIKQVQAQNKPCIILLNKADESQQLEAQFEDAIPFSAVTHQGADIFQDRIETLYPIFKQASEDMLILANARQLELLEQALLQLSNTIVQSERGEVLDLVLIHLTEVWESLGEITGSVAKDDLLDTLFSKFCLGK